MFESNDTIDLGFCQKIPKVELHAHLNVSFSAKTFQHLVDRKASTLPEVKNLNVTIKEGETNSLDNNFDLYRLAQKVFDDEYAIYKLSYDVIHEFSDDNVKYLELRSTPKEISSTGMTRRLYIETMIKAVKACEKEGLDILVKILPSIDRRLGVDVANITVDLAKELSDKYPGYIPGIDFSGDPKVLDAVEYIPVFNRARELGLKLALHLAEIPNHEETLRVLKESTPDRIGHGSFIHSEFPGLEDLKEIVIKRKIPIELCLTSNLKTQTVENYKEHHFKVWYDLNHPQILCTDGKGTYQCNLSDEYFQAAQAFNLTKSQMVDLSYKAIDYTFASTQEKENLKLKWKNIRDEFQK
ncbi:hypothetical protein LOTGIDRAFT_178823 [Lottia gigantea]|uniref:Adenosine deaminase domain-containing protein n=1 Tax=Lottia gigantea TaxID=225164 RepID=V4A6F7_LOTGI|nr:hypothetical protein LOTGIDRAFT_178823 [Lottia gigantea]ESO90600.1 hypothetical protein LOTGIDRAFT_178823 [Lottia gigantea]